MPDPKEKSEESNPLTEYVSQKYYEGGDKAEIQKKLSTNESAFNQMIAEAHADSEHKETMTLGEFKDAYYSTYGNPFEKKKSEPTTSPSPTIQEETPKEKVNLPATPEESGKQLAPKDSKPYTGSTNQLEWSSDREEPVSRLESANNTFTRKISEFPSELLEVSAILGKKLEEHIPIGDTPEKLNDSWMVKTAKNYRVMLDEIGIKKGEEQYKGEIMTDVLPSVAGDLAVMLMTGGETKAAKTMAPIVTASKSAATIAKTGQLLKTGAVYATSPTAVTAAVQIGSSEFKQAKEAGATDEQATEVALKNMGVGTALEAVPIIHFFNRINKNTGGSFTKYLKNIATTGAIQGTEEAVTEIAQQFYSNYTASQTYDATRKWYDGMQESGGIGFGMGFILGGMGMSLRKRQAVSTDPNEQAEIQKAIDFVDQKTTDLESGKLSDQGKENLTPTDEAINDTSKQDVVNEESIQQEPEETINNEVAPTKQTANPQNTVEESELSTNESPVITENQTVEPEINTQNDSTSEQQQIPGEVRIGQESIQAEPVETTSSEEVGTSGILQTPEPTIESEVKQPVKERATKISIGNSDYQVKVQDGEVKIRNKDNKKFISPSSGQGRKIIEEYKTKKMHKFSEGKTANTTETESEGDYVQSVLKTSENPAEIAQVWNKQTDVPLDAKEEVIKESLRRTPAEGIYQFGDRNNVSKATLLNYAGKKGQPIDVQAAEMANTSGMDITPQDIVDFIQKYPNGKRTAKNNNTIKPELAAKFKSLTGLELTTNFANEIEEFNTIYNKQKEHKYENKFISTQQLIEDIQSGKDVSEYEFLFDSPEEFKKTIKYAKQQIQSSTKDTGPTTTQTGSKKRTSDTGVKKESESLGEGAEEKGKRSGIVGSLTDKIRSLRDATSDTEKGKIAKQIIEEADGYLLNREGVMVDNDGSFALPNGKTFFDLLDEGKSVYYMDPDAKIANDIFDYQLIANELPAESKSEVQDLLQESEGAIHFDDAFRLGFIDQAKKMGYDGVLMKEIDGTDSTIQVLNTKAIKLVGGKELTPAVQEPINTQSDSDVTIAANKQKPVTASLGYFGGIGALTEIFHFNLNDITKNLHKTDVAKVFKKWLTVKGFIPNSVFKSWVATTGNINAELSKMDNMARDFRATVKKAYGLKIGQDLSIEQKAEINSALGGNKTSLASLPIEVQIAISEMRNHVDYLSQRMIDEGVIAGEYIPKFKENMGIYLYRSYRKNEGQPDWASDIDPQITNRAKAYIQQKFPDYTQDEVDGIINELLYTPDAPMNLIKTGKLGSKDLSILKARKDIAPEIRALYGEYNDPLINYTKSVMKMINIIEKHNFLTNVKSQGMDSFLFEKPNAKNYVKIAGEGSATMAPLNGLYTTPEIAKAFEEFNKSSKIKDNPAFQLFMKAVSIFKANKTVYNFSSHPRNFIGGSLMALANGHFNGSNLGESFATVNDHIWNSGSKERRDAYKESIQLGLSGDTGAASELKANLEDAKLGNEGNYKGGATRSVIKSIRGVIEGAYQGTDEAWKIYGYKNELARYKKAYPDMPEAELKVLAATIVRNTTPTYSLVPEVIKAMGNFPLLGTFVRFASENVRCAYNRAELTKQELSSDNPEVRKIGAQRLTGQLLAYSAAAGMSAASKYFYGISDEQEEDLRLNTPAWSKNSTFLYLGKLEDGKVNRIDLSQTDPASYFYDPIIATLDGKAGFQGNALDAAKELLSPFFSLNAVTEMAADAKNNQKTTGGYIVNPSLPFGDQVQGYAMYMFDNFKPGTFVSAEKIGKGVILDGKADQYGKIYDAKIESLAAFTGQRVSSLDYGKSLTFKSYEYQKQFANSKAIFKRDFKLKEQPHMSESAKADIAEEREKAITQSIEALKRDIKDYRKLYFAGIRLGVEKDIMQTNVNLLPADLRNIIKTETPLDKLKMPSYDVKKQKATSISIDEYLRNYLLK